MTNAPLRLLTEAFQHRDMGDDKMAFTLFQECVNNTITVASASYELGRYYEQGQVVPQDYKKAFEFYLTAADHDIADAQGKLADWFACGRHVPQDLEESKRWRQKEQAQREKDEQPLPTLAQSIRAKIAEMTGHG
jgi:hypothetical protein